MRARGYGAGLRARCQCVAERATALMARVLHARAWNLFILLTEYADILLADEAVRRSVEQVLTFFRMIVPEMI